MRFLIGGLHAMALLAFDPTSTDPAKAISVVDTLETTHSAINWLHYNPELFPCKKNSRIGPFFAVWNYNTSTEWSVKSMSIDPGADENALKIGFINRQPAGRPVHIHTLQSRIGIISSETMDGSISLYGLTGQGEITNRSAYLKFEPPASVPPKTSSPQQTIGYNGLLYTMDQGADKVWVSAVENPWGRLMINPKGSYDIPGGPRRGVFSPNGTLYVVTERNGSVFSINVKEPMAKPMIVRLAQDATPASPTTGPELLWTKLGLLMTQRHPAQPGEQPNAGDDFSLLSAKEGLVPKDYTYQKYWSKLDGIHGMALSPDGNYVVAGGMNNDNVTVFKLQEEGQQASAAGKLQDFLRVVGTVRLGDFQPLSYTWLSDCE